MTEQSKNSNLSAAKKAKNDEFYTQWGDIEREMNAYLEFDPEVFRDKVLLLPCDDPEWSNFAKFFALHFTEYGLKKLISTSYAPDSNTALPNYQPTLFELESPSFDAKKTRTNGKKFVLERTDLNGDGRVDIDDLHWEYLEGDGDFRSDEVTALRDEADLVITNPPFSLFREFIDWLCAGNVKFSVIGGSNAVSYKEIFPLLKNNKLWIGKGFHKGDAYFRVPESAKTSYADGVFNEDNNTVHFRNITWFTNIEHGRRHEPLELMTEADNIKFSKHKDVRGSGYRRYDNYDAIEVPRVDAIPDDYTGVMGVPVTFLDKYNPDQFEILGITDRQNEHGLKTREYSKADSPKHNDLNRRGALRLPDGSLKAVYVRLLVRKRSEEIGNLRVVSGGSDGLEDISVENTTAEIRLEKVTDELGNTHLVADGGQN